MLIEYASVMEKSFAVVDALIEYWQTGQADMIYVTQNLDEVSLLTESLPYPSCLASYHSDVSSSLETIAHLIADTDTPRDFTPNERRTYTQARL